MPTTPHVTAPQARNRPARDRVRAGFPLLAPLVALSSLVSAQDAPRRFALESAAGLRLHNVTAEPATLQGQKGIRVTISEAARREFTSKTPEERAKLAQTGRADEQLAAIEGLDFDNGVIEAEIAGAPMAGAAAGARGFVGLAFRLQSDMRTYDAFYLRPTRPVRRRSSAAAPRVAMARR